MESFHQLLFTFKIFNHRTCISISILLLKNVICPDCIGNRSFCHDKYNCIIPPYSVSEILETIVNIIKEWGMYFTIVKEPDFKGHSQFKANAKEPKVYITYNRIKPFSLVDNPQG